jgi:hypothetical protein
LLLVHLSKEASMAESPDWKMDEHRRENEDVSGWSDEEISGRLDEDDEDEEFDDEDVEDEDEELEESER